MTIILPTLPVAFAAFCVWLAVRIFNRRERWAKWTAVALVIVLLAYPLSFGPYVAFIWAIDAPDWVTNSFGKFYGPLDRTSRLGPYALRRAFEKYGNWWMDIGLWIQGKS